VAVGVAMLYIKPICIKLDQVFQKIHTPTVYKKTPRKASVGSRVFVMNSFDLFIEFLLVGGNLAFLLNLYEERVTPHGSNVFSAMPSALKLTKEALKCKCVNKKTHAQFLNFHIGSIGIQQILKTLRVEYLSFVDRKVSDFLTTTFNSARRDNCVLVEIGGTTWTGTPMFMYFNDIMHSIDDTQTRSLLLRTHDGWVHNSRSFRWHVFHYLPGEDGEILPKSINNGDHERLRMRCLDELMRADGLNRIVGMYVRGLMDLHCTAVTAEKRMARRNRFLVDNAAAIESLANPNAEFKFNPREDWENLGLEAFCMLAVGRLAENSLWFGLERDLIASIGRLCL